jgi:hypothetical protein
MCKGTHTAMKKDTASNAALSAADFCKVQFERYLDSLGFTRKVRWTVGEGQDAPAYYLELDGHQYAVEVTTLSEQTGAVTAGVPESALARFASPLMDLLGEANSSNGAGRLQQLARTLHLERPMARLRKYKAKVQEALVMLNEQLGEKRDKLRNVSLPKIVLVYDAYRSLEQDAVEGCLNRVSSLSSFQMVFITNWDRESYVVYP